MYSILAVLCVAAVSLFVVQRAVAAVDLAHHDVGAVHAANPLAGQLIANDHDHVHVDDIASPDAAAPAADPEDESASHQHLGDGSHAPALASDPAATLIVQTSLVLRIASNATLPSSLTDGLLRPPRAGLTTLA